MSIIVEGPDGSGKTGLVDRLAKRYGLPVSPRVVAKNTEPMLDLKKWVEDELDKPDGAILYDRHRLVSEPIYGPLLRPTPQPGFENVKWLTQQMLKFYSRRPFLIYCLPPLEEVLANVVKTEDNTVIQNSGKTAKIYYAYVARVALDSAAGYNVVIWDYKKAPGTIAAINYLVELELRRW